MLNHVRAFWICHRDAFLSSMRTLLRTPLATLMTLFVIAVTFLLPLFFGFAVDKLKGMTSMGEEGEHISLYLQKPMSEPASRAFLERVKGTPNVASARYVSPEEGLVALQEQEGMQDMIASLPDNPLPGMIDVSPAPGLAPEKIEQLYQTLRANPEVSQAQLDTVWVKRLHALLVFLKKASHVLMGILGLAVIFIVGNTLRATIQKRSEEIKVLKFIGATDAYIARPILYAGVLLGLGGALLAWGLIQMLLYSLSLALSPLLTLYNLDVIGMSLSVQEVGYLVFGSLVLGWMGAYVSIKQQLYTVL